MSVVSSELGISWEEAGLVVVIALVIYAVTLVGARLFGPRQFASLSTHDLVFVFALGSIIGRTVLVRTSLAGGVLGLATMFTVHALTSRLYRSSRGIHDLVRNTPILVVADGRPLRSQMQRARLGRFELRQLLRQQGHGTFEGLRAVVLEPTGQLSVIASDVPLAEEFLEEIDGADLLGAST